VISRLISGGVGALPASLEVALPRAVGVLLDGGVQADFHAGSGPTKQRANPLGVLLVVGRNALGLAAFSGSGEPADDGRVVQRRLATLPTRHDVLVNGLDGSDGGGLGLGDLGVLGGVVASHDDHFLTGRCCADFLDLSLAYLPPD
jgi:hypothetical protein